jgi:hypothetical protein
MERPGLRNIAGAAASLAKIAFFVFLILAVMAPLAGRRPVTWASAAAWIFRRARRILTA